MNTGGPRFLQPAAGYLYPDHEMKTQIHKWHKRGDARGFTSAGQVAHALRTVRSRPLNTNYAQTLSGDWPGGTGRHILSQFDRYLMDEINRRGGFVVRGCSDERLERKMRAHIRCECAWCGGPADFHQQRNQRFCSPECCHSYRS